MKLRHNHQIREKAAQAIKRSCGNACEAIQEAVALTRQRVLRDYSELVGEHQHFLRLALNEAEALAWQTEHPHLFFPTLAVEKAQSAVSWHQRQRAVRRAAAEVAFSE